MQKLSHYATLGATNQRATDMYITELMTALQVLKVQYGDIQVTVKNQQSFQLTLSVVDEVDPKTLQPIRKVIMAE